ncbi:hypothetical protein GGR52DRAFT_394920 [Hypoxylon sp. FL1284]|nr:hypothetical protein GGR52DRAFT_394920 [Hypoxylon sp. FL1284]
MAAKLTFLFYVSIWILAGQVSCGSIAGWWNTKAPSILMQDDDTGGIRYSLCNGNHTPIFPDDKTLTIPFNQYTAKNKTSLAATGWTDSETEWASIFYMDSSDEIVNAVLKCDSNSGHWYSTGEYIISGGSPKVASDTGLAAVLLGSTDGYRVFYNGLDGTLHQIGYTTTTTWQYYGVVSNDKMGSQAIAATFANKNITVVRPRDGKNVGVSRLYKDGLWHLSSFPESLTVSGNKSTNATEASDLQVNATSGAFTLPAWDGNASSLAMGIDRDYMRSVFYAGTDRKIYQAGSTNWTWSALDRPAGSAWPDVDAAGASIAVVSDFASDVMRLYYLSGGRMVEANGDRGDWQTATVLASHNESQVADGSDGSNSTSAAGASSADGGHGGLSQGAKAGISVGVTLGVIAIIGMLCALWFLRQRQRKRDEAAAAAAAAEKQLQQQQRQGQYAKSPSSGYTVATAAGSYEGYPPQAAYAYGGQQQQGYAQQAGLAHDGGWAYATPSADGQYPPQQYFYHQPQAQTQQPQMQTQQYYPQEMADQTRPVEMMGEGHYKEVP